MKDSKRSSTEKLHILEQKEKSLLIQHFNIDAVATERAGGLCIEVNDE